MSNWRLFVSNVVRSIAMFIGMCVMLAIMAVILFEIALLVWEYMQWRLAFDFEFVKTKLQE